MLLSRPSKSSRIQPLSRVLQALLFGILLFGTPVTGISATIPTPAPGAGTPVTAPTPNPTQYNFVAGTTIASTAVNSNSYKIYNDLNTVISALNSCSYVPGAAIGSVSGSGPIGVSVGACTPGSGANLQISFNGTGSTLNVQQVNATSGFVGGTVGSPGVNEYQWGTDAGGSVTGGIGSSDTTSVAGVTGNTLLLNANYVANVLTVDNNGNVGAKTALYGANGITAGSMGGATYFGVNTSSATLSVPLQSSSIYKQTVGSTTYVMPYDASSTGTSANTHMEHGSYNFGTIGAGACLYGSGSTFAKAFSSAPIVVVTASQTSGSVGVGISAYVYSVTSTGFSAAYCNGSGSSTANSTINWIALGE